MYLSLINNEAQYETVPKPCSCDALANDVALPAQLYQSLLAWTSLDPESLQTHKAFLSTFFNGDGFLLGGCRPNLALIYTALDWFLFQVVVTDWQIRVDRIRSQSRILLPYNSLSPTGNADKTTVWNPFWELEASSSKQILKLSYVFYMFFAGKWFE